MKHIRFLFAAALLCSLPALAAAAESASPYAEIDRHALAVPASAATSVDALAETLTAPARTEAEAARAIYRWMAAHIAYDVQSYREGISGETDPERVLRKGSAVCSGYAALFTALARAAGFQVVVIHGQGKGDGYHAGGDVGQSDHSWNAIKIDGQWRLVDATWGAGTVIGGEWHRRFDGFYFLTPPEQFINDHFPDDPRWQLLPQPLSRAEYDRQVRLYPTFYRLGLRLGNHQEALIRAARSATITFVGPDDLQLEGELKGLEDDKLDYRWAICRQENSRYRLLVRWPRPGSYKLTVYAKCRGDPGKSWSAAVYRIEGSDGMGDGGAFPLTFDALDRLGLRLDSNLQSRIVAVGGGTRVTLAGPAGLRLWATLQSAEGEDLDPRWTLCQRMDGRYQVLVRWPRAREYRLVIYADAQDQTGLLQSVVVYRIEGAGNGAVFPRTYDDFGKFGVTLTCPFWGILRAGVPQRFTLRVPGAQSVAVAQNGQWRRLTANGDEYTGLVAPTAGELTVVVDGRGIATYEAE